MNLKNQMIIKFHLYILRGVDDEYCEIISSFPSFDLKNGKSLEQFLHSKGTYIKANIKSFIFNTPYLIIYFSN